MRVIVVIPARSGSKGIPGKNLVDVAGLSLVGRAVLTARAFLERVRASDAVILVDTDSPEIAEEGRRYGASVPFLRPPELATDTTPTIENVRHALNRLVPAPGPNDAVVLLQPTSPLRTPEDVEACWRCFDPPTTPSVISVTSYPHPVEYALRVASDGTIEWGRGTAPASSRRQDFEQFFSPNGAIYIATVELVRRGSILLPGVTRAVVMPPQRSLDLDTPDDLELIRAVAAHDASPGNGSGRETVGPAVAELRIGDRWIGDRHAPLVIAEVGINHEGDVRKALRMVDDAHAAGAECVKFQCHVIDDEMIPNDVVPGNAAETIWEIMSRCALSEADERRVKGYVESKGMIYLSTPFSRAAAHRLEGMGVPAYKIGSGECNNYPLVREIASFGKPVLLSTGMNDLDSIEPAVEILRDRRVPFALLHCTSMYPTPYDKVRLGALRELAERFPDAVLGLSDHSVGIYTCLAAVALGARVLEKHFTSDKSWPGPDVPISIDPVELRELLVGSRAVFAALGGRKTILQEEQPTIDFAYACVVASRDIACGELLSIANIWVKRPGTGPIKAAEFDSLLGRRAARPIPKDRQLSPEDVA